MVSKSLPKNTVYSKFVRELQIRINSISSVKVSNNGDAIKPFLTECRRSFVKSLLLFSFGSESRHHDAHHSCNSQLGSASMERLRRVWLVFLILVDPGWTRLLYDDDANESAAGPLAPIVGRDVQLHQEEDEEEEPDQAGNAPPAPSGETSKPHAQKRGVQLRQDRKRRWISEIRPPNGSKKVWLGSYDTFQEAAAAFDVGIYYYKKRIPYHFADSHAFLLNLPPSHTAEGTPLGPEELRKTVQGQAKLAAQRVRRRAPGKFRSVTRPASHQNDDHCNKSPEGKVLDDHSSTISPLHVVPRSNEFAEPASTCKSLSGGANSANIAAAAESPTRSDGVGIVER